MSITKCLGNINVSEDEAIRVKDLAATHRYEGMGAKKANIQAAQDVLSELMNERNELGQKIAEQGGALPSRASTQDGALASRVDMGFKEVTKRVPELTEAAQKVKDGTMTKAEYAAIQDRFKPVEPYTSVPTPAGVEEAKSALTSNQKDKFGVPTSTLETGHKVGVRLDIPAYTRHGKWVVSVHEQQSGFSAGKVIGYESVAYVTDATFGSHESASLGIAAGKPKGTIAVLKGTWKKITPESAKSAADKVLGNKRWVQVGFDPERHSYFYDRTTMEPVVSAEQVIQVGPLVLAKNPVYESADNFLFSQTNQPGRPAPAQPDIDEVAEVAEEAVEGSTVSFAAFRGLGSNEASIEVTRDDAIEILGFDPGIEIVTAESGTMKIDTPMAFNLDTRQIQINPDYPVTPRWEAAQFMVEEMLHSVDVVGSRSTISASSAMFSRNGAIFLEAEANFKGASPELRRFLAYPLHDYFELTQTEKQAELFARLGVLYLGDPQLMQETMPNAYKLYKSIFTLADNNRIRAAVRQDTGARRQVPSELSESTDVSEVRGNATGTVGQSGASAGLGRFRDAVVKATKGDRLGSRIQLSGQFLNVRSGVGFGENWVPSKATLGQIEGPVLSVKHILTKEGRAQRVQAGRRRLQDAYIVWRDIQDAMVEMGGKLSDFSDAYGKFTQIEGRVGEQFKQIEDRYTKPLEKGMLKKKVSLQELGDFMLYKAVPGRNAKIAERNKAMPDGGSGIMTDDSVAYLDSISKERTKELEELAQYVYDMLAEKQDILVKSGRMSDSLRDQLNEEEPFYVPMKGSEILDDANQMVHDANSGSRGFDQTRDLFKTAKGRKTVAADIVATAMSDTASAIISAENNIVGKAVLQFAKDNPNKNLWKVNPIKVRLIYNKKTGQVEQRVLTNYKALATDPNVFVTWVGGKPYAIEFRDGRGGPSALSRALKNMEVDSVPWYIRHLGGLNRYLSYMNTALSPEFLLTNPARDIQTALAKAFGDYDAGISGKVLKNLPRAIKAAKQGLGDRAGFETLLKKEKKEAAAYEALSDAEKKGKPKPSHLARYVREYLESGGKTDYFRNKTVEEMKLDLENGLKDAQGGGYNAVKRGLRQLGLYIEHANGILENSTRISMYITLREEMTKDKNGKVIHKYSPHQAAVAAKNLTVNFNRKGEDGVLVNSLFLFYNASMQGTHLTLQLLKKPKVQAMMVALGGAAAALVQYNILMGGEDDDGEPNYFRIGDYEKERNLIIMWADGSGNYTKFPLPWGLNVPINAAQAIVHVIHGKGIRGQSPMEQAAWVAGNAWNSFSPVGESGLNIIAPTVLDPFVDIITNKNFAESRIMPDKNPYEKVATPNAYRAFSSVSPWWRISAEALNSVTRGNEQKSGIIDISPEAIEHLVNTYTGAAGGFAGRVATWLTDPEMPTSQKPFVRKVYGDVSEYVVNDRYADNKANVFYLGERKEFLGERSRNGAKNKAEFDEFRRDNIGGLRLENFLKSTEGALRKLYTDRRELRANPVRNKARLDRIEEMIDRRKRRFNKKYNEVFMP